MADWQAWALPDFTRSFSSVDDARLLRIHSTAFRQVHPSNVSPKKSGNILTIPSLEAIAVKLLLCLLFDTNTLQLLAFVYPAISAVSSDFKYQISIARNAKKVFWRYGVNKTASSKLSKLCVWSLIVRKLIRSSR